ncbi:hypothetical protein FBU30_005952 [Linnemannia zychae]|nr:hypothetical protein FBU30_005952 [Linnemannia zychae]
MARNSEFRIKNGSPQLEEPPTFQVPAGVVAKAQERQNQLKSISNKKNNIFNHSDSENDSERDEEVFRILQYPTEPWGRASRTRNTGFIPSRRLISSLIEDIRTGTDSQDSVDISRNRRNRRNYNPNRVALLKRQRSASTTSASNLTESSDDTSESVQRPTTSTTRKKPLKQQRVRQQSLSDISAASSAITLSTSRKSTQSRKARRFEDFGNTHYEEGIGETTTKKDNIKVEEEIVKDEMILADDDDARDSDYTPGKRATMLQKKQEEKLVGSNRQLSIRLVDNDSSIVRQLQKDSRTSSEIANDIPRLNKGNVSRQAKEEHNIIERMDCVMIPVIPLPRNNSASRNNSAIKPSPIALSAENTRRNTRLTIGTTTAKEDTLISTVPTKMMTRRGKGVDSRTQKDTNPAVIIDAPRKTRSETMKEIVIDPDVTKSFSTGTSTPLKGQGISKAPKVSIQQSTKDESSQKSAVIDSPHKLQSMELAKVKAKTFHGWWLKRKNALIWHTSTIKEASEPCLVMTFTGSFYRLSGSVNAERMENNGFSKEVIKAFKHGFPANWRTILSQDDEKQSSLNTTLKSGRQDDTNINKPSTQLSSPLTQQTVQKDRNTIQQPEKVSVATKMVTSSSEIPAHDSHNGSALPGQINSDVALQMGSLNLASTESKVPSKNSEAALTSSALFMSALGDTPKEQPTSLPLSVIRRSSTPDRSSSQVNPFVSRRASFPAQSVRMLNTKNPDSQNKTLMDRPQENMLDGNLRMRSMAVVEQIREHTRQYPDLPLALENDTHQKEENDINMAGESPQEFGGSSTTTLLARSLSSISSAFQSTFDDFDLNVFGSTDQA